MPIRIGKAKWKGILIEGTGNVSTESNQLNSHYGFSSRFESGKGTNPEELLGAAHAACFSMALAHELASKGYVADEVETEDKVHIDKTPDGFRITKIEITTEANVARIDESLFNEIAEQVKNTCPVSRALSATPMTLTARLRKR